MGCTGFEIVQWAATGSCADVQVFSIGKGEQSWKVFANGEVIGRTKPMANDLIPDVPRKLSFFLLGSS